ncbi:alpha/beta fold hydrolase [Streptomyces sp. NPDC051162]|uniref:alpha/beta fold hydrolase n=1 Tax=Streptomyces sp. NPDC051162 TaxID=3154747 RepID=UPI00341B533E
MWDRQIPELTRHWRVLRFDLPGHGGAPAEPAPAVGELTDRLLATLDGLGVDRFGYAGCSIGGAMGADLALRHPHRLAALALIAASARSGTADSWHQRGNTVRTSGMDPIARSAPESWFTPNFAAAQPAIVDWAVQMVSTTDPGCYVAACDALAAFDVRAELGRIGVPALVLVGAEDQVTPPADARVLVAGIHDARLAVVPGASHLAPVEQPAAVTDLLVRHFTTAWQLSTQQNLSPVAAPMPQAAVSAPGPVPGQAFGPAPGRTADQEQAPFPAAGPAAGPAPAPAPERGETPGQAPVQGLNPDTVRNPGKAPVQGLNPDTVRNPGKAPAQDLNPDTVRIAAQAPAPVPAPAPAPGQPVPGHASGYGFPPPEASHAGPAHGPVGASGQLPGHASGYGFPPPAPEPGQAIPGHASGYGFPPAAPGGTSTPMTQQPAPAPVGFGPPPALDPEPVPAAPDPYDRGALIRREVLGDAHVDAAEAARDELTGDYDDFVTRYAWGGVWDRPGLDRRSRALITLAALTAGGRLDGLALHTRAALRCGVTPDEIKETLLHTAVYCGVPAADAAFQVARRVIAEGPAPRA